MQDVAKTYTVDTKTYYVQPPLAIGSYMQGIHEPQGFEEGDDKSWGCQFRWPKEDPEVKSWAAEMVNMFRVMIASKWGQEKMDNILRSCRLPLRDGDKEEREEYHGYLFMNVRNKFRQPIILGPHAKALSEDMITTDYIYSGAWYRSGINFYTYDVRGKGIGAGLQVLMKIKDGERLDGGMSPSDAEDKFSGFADQTAGLAEAADQLSPEDKDEFDFF